MSKLREELFNKLCNKYGIDKQDTDWVGVSNIAVSLFKNHISTHVQQAVDKARKEERERILKRIVDVIVANPKLAVELASKALGELASLQPTKENMPKGDI